MCVCVHTYIYIVYGCLHDLFRSHPCVPVAHGALRRYMNLLDPGLYMAVVFHVSGNQAGSSSVGLMIHFFSLFSYFL